MCATPSPIATGLSVVVHALDTRAMTLPGPEWSWCRARPAHSARHALAAPHETMCGGPAHHRLSPSRVGPDHPTGRASPGTARDVCDTTRPRAHGMLGVVAHPVPTPGEGISESRARRDRGGTRTP